MPTVICPVMEVPEHIFKPVIEQIACRLLYNLDLVDVIKDNIYINTDFMSRTQTSTLEKDAIIDVEALRVDAQIQMNPSSQKWDVYNFSHTTAYGISRNNLADPFPIYRDVNNGVRVVEYVTPVTIQMNCNISLESATLAYRLPYQLYNTYGNSGLVHYEDLFFDYPIPKQVLHVLNGVYLQDRLTGKDTGISFIDYVKQYSNGLWAINVNRNVENSYEIVKNVSNLQALVAVEYGDDRPSVNKAEQSPNVWELSVNLQVQFGVPDLNVIQYPVVICNKLLPATYIPRSHTERFNRLLGPYQSSSLTEVATKKLKSATSAMLDPGVLRVPHYDDWLPPSNATIRQFGHFIVAIIGITVDENPELQTTLDLKEFKDEAFELAPFLIEILKAEGPKAVYPTSLVSLTVFANDDIITPGTNLTVDKELVLTFKGTTINKQYHLCISLCRDLSKLEPFWYYLLIKYYHCFDLAYQRRIDAYIRRKVISPDYTETEDGHIVDTDGNVVGNVNDPQKPDNNYVSVGPVTGGTKNGIYFKSRVIRSNINTHRSC